MLAFSSLEFKKIKAIFITDFEWLTDYGEVVSLRGLSPSTPQENSWYSFLLEAESTPGPQ
jgi:hypothetical protein